MMVNNIYRGKRLYDNKWIYGNLVVSEHGAPHIIPSKYFIEDGHHLRYEDDSDKPAFFNERTIGQFTGISDINNKLIFQGDIVIVRKFLTRRSSVFLNRGTFDVHFANNPYVNCVLSFYHQTQLNVIGNIFDNPNLLEPKWIDEMNTMRTEGLIDDWEVMQ